MDLKKARREFKKHYHYLNKLKEGGKAWEREAEICERLLQKCKDLYKNEWRAKYGY